MIWVFLVTFLHSVSSYNYCSVTPQHTLCGYTAKPDLVDGGLSKAWDGCPAGCRI